MNASPATLEDSDQLDVARLLARVRSAGLPILDVRVLGERRKATGSDAAIRLELMGPDASGTQVVHPGYLRTMDARRFAEVSKKWSRLRPVPSPFGAGVVALPEEQAVLFLFPNDHKLRQAAALMDRDRAKRILSTVPAFAELRFKGRRLEITVVRYKPEQRLIVRMEGDAVDRAGRRSYHRLFLRLFEDSRGLELLRRNRCLAASAGPELSAHGLGAPLGGRIYVEEALAGQDLLAARRLPDEDTLIALVETVARLQRATIDGLPRVETASLATRCSDIVDWIGEIAPSQRAAAHCVLELIRQRASSGPVRTLHGDLHLRQVLATEAGLRLVDLSNLMVGPGIEDLAQLLAHVEALSGSGELLDEGPLTRSLAILTDTWLRIWPDDRPEHLVAPHAAALLAQALIPLRRGDARGEAKAAALLERARRRLEGLTCTSSSSLVLSPDLDVFPAAKPRWPARRRSPDGTFAYGVLDPSTARFDACSPESDPGLPALGRWVARGRLVSWRPGRRAVVALEVGFAKILGPGRAARAAERWRELQRAFSATPVRVPAVLAVEDDALVLESAPGRSLRDGIVIDLPGCGWMERVFGALRAFHEGPLEAATSAPSRTIAAWCAMVEPFDRARADRRRELGQRWERVSPGPASGLVHGDLHPANIFTSGSVVTFIDVDGCRAGRIEDDVGNLLAEVLLDSWRTGTQGLGRIETALATAAAILGLGSETDLRWALAGSLLRLSCVHTLRSETRSWVDSALSSAEELLECTR